MRDIKFRAWLIQQKKMVPVFGINPGDSLTVRTEGPHIAVNSVYGLNEADTFLGKCAEVMQYTGLKDKNGKEIYEGDILTVIHRKDGEVARGPIVFDEEKGAFGLQDHNLVWRLTSGDMSNEVIGNIYENPELLNV